MTDVDDVVLEELPTEPPRWRRMLGAITVAVVAFVGAELTLQVLVAAATAVGLPGPGELSGLAKIPWLAVGLVSVYVAGSKTGFRVANRLWLTPAERAARDS